MNSSEVLLHKAASHGYCYRIYLCSCLLFTEGYLVADAVAYLSSPLCLNVASYDSTHQCKIDITPSQVNMLVPGFQEPSTADLLSELISIHEINVLFDTMRHILVSQSCSEPVWNAHHLPHTRFIDVHRNGRLSPTAGSGARTRAIRVM